MTWQKGARLVTAVGAVAFAVVVWFALKRLFPTVPTRRAGG